MINPSLGISIALAFLLHAVLISLLKLWQPPIPEPQTRSIPIQLTSTASVMVNAENRQTRASDQARPKREVVQTQSTSSHQQLTQKPIQETANTNNKTASNTQPVNAKARTQTASNSSISAQFNDQIRRSQSHKAGASFKSLFQSSQANSNLIDVVSSDQNLEELSLYQQQLIMHLAEANYDAFRQVMEETNLDKISYVLELELFANGALKYARVVKSSGLSAIDRLAHSRALNSSPYPTPPEEDLYIGFTYTVPVEYRPTNRQPDQ